jgi:predicted aldo/keto reductase-like oxidoreductase
MAKNAIPIKFSPWTNLWDSWHDWLLHSKVSALQACLKFPLSFAEVDRIVVGADDIQQLQEIITITEQEENIDFPDLCCEEEKLINPAYWSTLVG